MKMCTILLSSVTDVKDFVNIAGKYTFDIDLISGRYVVDAKSIMGIFSLDLQSPMTLDIHAEDAATNAFMEEIKKYIR